MGGATLIISDRTIGDMILAPGLLRTLKYREPDTPIDVVATDYNASIALLFPEVRKVLVRLGRAAGGFKINRHLLTCLKHVSLGMLSFPRLLYQIKRGNYSKAYILCFNLKYAWGPHFAGGPERIGHLSTKNSHVLLTKPCAGPKQPQHKSRFIAMFGHSEGCNFDATPPPYSSIAVGTPARLPNNLLKLAEASKLIAFCPGGMRDEKKWAASSFGKVAASLLERDFQIIILGASDHQAMAQDIVRNSPTGSILDLTGNFNLLETIKVLSRCHALVSNDTGLMHAAVALGIITLGIFIVTNLFEWHPLGRAAQYISTYVDGCETSSIKPQPPSPEQVIAKLEEMFQVAPVSS